jgi:hypothetical protein
MKRWLAVAAAFVVTVLLTTHCRRSPTDPTQDELNGVWEGALQAYPSGEDWSSVRLTTTTVGGVVTGALVPKSGPAHAVTGQRVANGFTLEVHDLPQQTPCVVQLFVDDIGSAAIAGDIGGRCPNTLTGDFRLTRWP